MGSDEVAEQLKDTEHSNALLLPDSIEGADERYALLEALFGGFRRQHSSQYRRDVPDSQRLLFPILSAELPQHPCHSQTYLAKAFVSFREIMLPLELLL